MPVPVGGVILQMLPSRCKHEPGRLHHTPSPTLHNFIISIYFQRVVREYGFTVCNFIGLVVLDLHACMHTAISILSHEL